MSVHKTATALVIGLLALATTWGVAFAEHGSGVVITPTTIACGETTFSASVPGGTNVENMYLVVHAHGVTQSENIP